MRDHLPHLDQLPLWPLISAAVFLLLFLGLVWWVFKGSRKAHYEETERLPFEHED